MAIISFVGDISLNNRYNLLFNNGIDPFASIREITRNSDYFVGNLECLGEGSKGENLFKKPRLKTNVQTLKLLNNMGIRAVSLAHNHIYDNLYNGYIKTINILIQNNIDYFGVGKSDVDASKPFFKEIKNIKFGFLNYVSKDTNPNIPVDAELTPNFFDLEKVLTDIKSIRDLVNHIIIILHWGGRVENGCYPDFNQPSIARKLIDAGADLIIGHHSHTLQPFEKYKNKYIFYSLGNFCFDDIIFEDKVYKKWKKKHKESLLIKVRFSEVDYKIEYYPIFNFNLTIKQKKNLLLKFFFRNIIFFLIGKNKYIWRLYFIKIKYINPVTEFLLNDEKSFEEKIYKINIKFKTWTNNKS